MQTSIEKVEPIPVKVIEGRVTAEPYKMPFKEPQTVDLGEFRITAYCPCTKCCGKSDGITSTGVVAQSNRTIAVDPNTIPYGSRVIINGNEYVAEDCGGAIKGNKIDMFFDTHQEALQWGVKYMGVTMFIE